MPTFIKFHCDKSLKREIGFNDGKDTTRAAYWPCQFFIKIWSCSPLGNSLFSRYEYDVAEGVSWRPC
jgi:hypothetical protein